MTCKDCIHCGVCPTWNDDIPYVEGEYCGGFKKFKNKSDMQKVKHGEWKVVYRNKVATVYECSNCGHLQFGTSDYCICGTKMNEKDDAK